MEVTLKGGMADGIVMNISDNITKIFIPYLSDKWYQVEYDAQTGEWIKNVPLEIPVYEATLWPDYDDWARDDYEIGYENGYAAAKAELTSPQAD